MDPTPNAKRKNQISFSNIDRKRLKQPIIDTNDEVSESKHSSSNSFGSHTSSFQIFSSNAVSNDYGSSGKQIHGNQVKDRDQGQNPSIDLVCYEKLDKDSTNDNNEENTTSSSSSINGRIQFPCPCPYPTTALFLEHKYIKKEPRTSSKRPLPTLPTLPQCHSTELNKLGTNCSTLRKTPNLTVIVGGAILVKPFPLLVHEMLSQSNSKSLIKWTHNGTALTIVGKSINQLDNMLQKFSLPKFTIFRKKLYLFGWRKLNPGKYKIAFFHQNFHRDSDLGDIARINSKNQWTGTRSTTGIACTGVSPSTSVKTCNRNKVRQKIIVTVTPSPRRQQVISQTSSAKVMLSPISMKFAPSRRSRIPISPIDISCKVFDDDEEENVIKSNSSTFTTVTASTPTVVIASKTVIAYDTPTHTAVTASETVIASKTMTASKSTAVTTFANQRFVDIHYETDDESSKRSVPMTPLSINLHKNIFDLVDEEKVSITSTI